MRGLPSPGTLQKEVGQRAVHDVRCFVENRMSRSLYHQWRRVTGIPPRILVSRQMVARPHDYQSRDRQRRESRLPLEAVQKMPQRLREFRKLRRGAKFVDVPA